MKRMVEEGVRFDAIVTDCPYHLTSIVKRFGKPGSAPTKSNGATGVYERSARGFMGKEWDGGGISFHPQTWGLCYELLKPGGHLLAFGGTRTFHRIGWAIEGGGFEIRDCVSWLYGSGFPKSHNMKGEWEGWGTALKPAWEPIILARKPLSESSVGANVLEHGTGALNIGSCRIDAENNRPWRQPAGKGVALSAAIDGSLRNPIEDRSDKGRWPANVCHDGSEEVLEAFAAFGESKSPQPYARASGSASKAVYGEYASRDGQINASFGDTGTAARFFYSAKADKEDRWGSKHPTVKPVDLMRWLVRLVTPPGGTVLDPFAGSGTTGIACMAEGFNAVLIEREAEYHADIQERLAYYRGEGRHWLARKAEQEPEKAGGHDLPLFTGGAQ
jgi:site-specific DNA-methyltransferase (adenine-specific)